MPTPTIQAYRQIQRQQRAALDSLISQTEAALHQDYAAIPAAVKSLYAPLLDRYASDLAALRAEEENTGARLSLSWLTDHLAHVQAIERTLRSQVDGFAQNAAHVVTHAQASAIPEGAQTANALGHAALAPVKDLVVWNRPNPNALQAFLGRASDGSPLADLFDGFGPASASAAREALMLGLSMGDGPAAIASALADALNVAYSRAMVIARTETIGAYRAAASATYQANSDVLDGWYWSADASARTCAMCLAMDGTLHPVSETLDSHPSCRCTQVPKTKSWADLLGPGVDTSDITETSYTPTQTGADWFDQQDAATQRNILGSQAAYDAYANGDLALSDMVGVSHSPQWGTSRYQKSWRQIQKGR